METMCIDKAVRFFQDNPELFTEHPGLCDIESLLFHDDAFTTIQDMTYFVADLDNPARAIIEMDDYAIELIDENNLCGNQSMIDKFNLIWCDIGRWICENEWESVVYQHKHFEYHDMCVAVKDA
jgi:hypothetical protein